MGILYRLRRERRVCHSLPFHSREREINEIHQISFLVEIRFPRSVCIEAASRAHTHIPPPRWGMAGRVAANIGNILFFHVAVELNICHGETRERESCGGVSLAARPAISRGIRRDKPGPAFRTPLGPIYTEKERPISSPPPLSFSSSNSENFESSCKSKSWLCHFKLDFSLLIERFGSVLFSRK